MKILGIGLSHCAGVALIIDGKLVFAQEEDRFSKKRRHKGWPTQSLAFALDAFGLKEEDIDLCVYCDLQTDKALQKRIKAKQSLSVHHHLSHIMSSWALVEWADFDAVSVDGGGDYGSWQSYARIRNRVLTDWRSNCGYIVKNGDKMTRPLFRRHRPGRTFGSYWSAPAVQNFGMLDRNGIGGYEGKLMGLAGHGNAAAFDPKQFRYDGRFSVRPDGAWHFIETHGYPKIGDPNFIIDKSGARHSLADVRMLRKEEKKIICEYDLKNVDDLRFAAHFAAFLQERTNEVFLELFDKNFSRNVPVAASGGTFGNVVVNGLLNDIYTLYVTPPMGDDGLALGAAAWGAYLSGRREIDADSMYLGFDAGSNVDVDTGDVAELLAANRIVGLIEGPMELGPRALGARSIIADPRDQDSNLTINERLGRVEYMPFAPVVLAEHASDVLVGWKPEHLSSAHMTLVYHVAEKWRDKLKGVVHVDGTARPQVIQRGDNPVYYEILKAFHTRTGLPALINTSFNAHGEPILRTVEDGMNALYSGRVDALVAGNKLTLANREMA